MLEGLKNYYIYNGRQTEEQAAQSAANKIDNYAAEPATGWTDWKKLLFRTGTHQNYQANVSGGNDRTPFYTSTSKLSLARIYMERRKELVGEGHRYFDALRRGETITRYTSEANRGWHEILNTDMQSYNTWTYKKQLPLIPIDEINGNSEIQQNPLY